jgi:hypothetical protein
VVRAFGRCIPPAPEPARCIASPDRRRVLRFSSTSSTLSATNSDPIAVSENAKSRMAPSRNPARPGGQVSGDVAGRGRPGCAQVFHPRGRYALEPGCGAVLAGRWYRLSKRMPEVIGDKVFAIIEPQVGEPQFMHCRFEREWREGKVVGLVAATTSIYQHQTLLKPLSARAKRCSVPVRHQQRKAKSRSIPEAPVSSVPTPRCASRGLGSHNSECHPRQIRSAVAKHSRDPGSQRAKASGAGSASEQRSAAAWARCSPARVVAVRPPPHVLRGSAFQGDFGFSQG